MFNLEKREIFIILSLLAVLLVGLLVCFHQKSAPSIDVEINSFAPDGGSLIQTKKININEADIETLSGLKGIGKTLAARISEYRTKNGNFRSIEELKKVKGVGEKLFEKIKDNITIE